MKKVILTLALAAFAFAANAQFVVGGNCGYNFYNGGHEWDRVVRSNTTTEYTLPNDVTSSLTIAPKIGYNINENMQVGISIGYNASNSTNYSKWNTEYYSIKDFEGWSKHSASSFVIAPYFRHTFLHMGNFAAFVEGQVTFGLGFKDKYHDFNTKVADYYAPSMDLRAVDTVYTGNTKATYLSISVVPGVNYKLTEKMSLDLYIDLLSITYNRTVTHYLFEDETIQYTHETKNVNSDFHFGANFNAQTLQSHLGYFRLGFNYHF